MDVLWPGKLFFTDENAEKLAVSMVGNHPPSLFQVRPTSSAQAVGERSARGLIETIQLSGRPRRAASVQAWTSNRQCCGLSAPWGFRLFTVRGVDQFDAQIATRVERLSVVRQWNRVELAINASGTVLINRFWIEEPISTW